MSNAYRNDILTNYEKYLRIAYNFIRQSEIGTVGSSQLSASGSSQPSVAGSSQPSIAGSSQPSVAQYLRLKAIDTFERVTACIEVTDYLLIDSKPQIPHDKYVEIFFNLGTLYKTYVEVELRNTTTITQEHVDLFRKAIDAFVMILRIRFEDSLATKQIVSVYTQLCFHYSNDLQRCLQYLQEALFYAPTNEIIHYNLGFVYHRLNKLEMSIIHFKTSIELCRNSSDTKESKESTQLIANNYTGIVTLYRSIKQWPQALFYLQQAEKIAPKDPQIQNQLGVVYTEMRRTDLAEKAYRQAIKLCPTDSKELLSEIYLNYGHMHSYNGDNQKSIDCYNKSLKISPNFHLPFQNKLMNLNYLFDQLDDKMYILQQHKLINKLLKKEIRYHFEKRQRNSTIRIGIVSGDFADHPVYFFISTFLTHFDSSKFEVTCYSEQVINTAAFNKNLKFKFIKNMSAETAADMIYNDKIDILLDLAGHTAFNRLDIFALKPAPVQVTYIGYPYSTGLNEMDYRITDNYCDDISISQSFYTERLITLPDCFLCYDPIRNGQYIERHPPKLEESPFCKNGYITFGCFNRVNKMTDSVIRLFNKILTKFTTVRFVFKTKALLNSNIRDTFLSKFDASVRNRISILDCTILHEDHLLTYNDIDIAIDTFPYSGTTTSCEALYMGVPVFSLKDTVYSFHAQNVTASILKNSDLDDYIVESEDELFGKIRELLERPSDFWVNLKGETRRLFTSGKVCDKENYLRNLSELFIQLVEKSK